VRSFPRIGRPRALALLASAALAPAALAGCGGDDLTLPNGPAERLVLVTAPPSSARIGVALDPQPVVRLAAESGAEVPQAGVTVVASIGEGGGVLHGATTVRTDETGTAAFEDLWVDGPDGDYRLIFSAEGLQSVATEPFELSVARPVATEVVIAEHRPSPSDVGRAVRFTVTVRPAPGGGTPDGTFRAAASTGENCTETTMRGSCELIFNSPGTRTVTATFLGDERFAEGTSSAVTHEVRDVVGATRTTLGLGPDPADAGATVTAWITVKGPLGIPVFGLVSVYANTEACGHGDLVARGELSAAGEARLPVENLAAGVHVMRACYSGAPGFAPSEDLASVTVR
jgi:hypothetical protein